MDDIKKPSWRLHATEALRATAEFFRGLWRLLITRRMPPDTGEVVVVVPSLLTADWATAPLRYYLRLRGHTVYGWELGHNFGSPDKLPLLTERVVAISRRHGGRGVVLVGWSMGGLFAREVARNQPRHVRRVITLAAPFANIHAPSSARFVFQLLNSNAKIDKGLVERLRLPLPMPSLAVYSKRDGILPWQACMNPVEDALHHNCEVTGSHVGMGVNPEVMCIVDAELRRKIED